MGPRRGLDRGSGRRPDRAGGGAAPTIRCAATGAEPPSGRLARPPGRSRSDPSRRTMRRPSRRDRGARLPAARPGRLLLRWRRADARPTGSRSSAAHRVRRRRTVHGCPGPEAAVDDRAGGTGPRAPRSPSCSSPASGSTTSARGDAPGRERRRRASSSPAGPQAPAADLAATVAGWQAAAPGPGPLGRGRPGGRAGPDPPGARASTRCPRRSSRAPCPPAELAALADRLGAALRRRRA